MSRIIFHQHSSDYNPTNQDQLILWLQAICRQHEFTIKNINYILCSDEYLLEVNRSYLNHDYYTDIITFDLSEEENVISSDIYISIDRVRDNAAQFNQSFEHEFLRVVVHGVLHLLGYSDKTEKEQEIMREKENECIDLFINN